MDDSVFFFFMEVECIGKTQIIHMEEAEERHRVIRLECRLEIMSHGNNFK